MMFHKQYYKLDEAAQKLGIDVDTILSMEFEGSLFLCYVHVPKGEDDYVIEVVLDDDNEKYRERIFEKFSDKYLNDTYNFDDVIESVNKQIIYVCGREPFREKVIEAVTKVIDGTIEDTFLIFMSVLENKKDLGDSISKYELYPYTPITLERPHVQRVIHEDGTVEIVGYIADCGKVADEKVCRRQSSQIVIIHQELTRLLALKAQLDGKPTLEQVQAENEALKQQLEALSNSTTKGKQQQREQALSYWMAGKGLDTAKRMKQAEIHEELKHVNGLFQIAESTFEDFWQEQKLIELDAGKR